MPQAHDRRLGARLPSDRMSPCTWMLSRRWLCEAMRRVGRPGAATRMSHNASHPPSRVSQPPPHRASLVGGPAPLVQQVLRYFATVVRELLHDGFVEPEIHRG